MSGTGRRKGARASDISLHLWLDQRLHAAIQQAAQRREIALAVVIRETLAARFLSTGWHERKYGCCTEHTAAADREMAATP